MPPNSITPTPFPIHRLVSSFERRQRLGIQLYAGTNYMSPMAEQALASGIGVMPAIGRPFAKQQPGTDEISAIEELLEGQVNRLLGGRWAEARLQSCTLANAAVYAAFSRPGDLIASIAPDDGGHVSHQAEGTVGLMGRQAISLPFKNGRYDDDAAASLIKARAPRIVMVGASVMLDPYLLSKTVSACREVAAVLTYDASHVLGLVAGGLFQNPLEIGADLMTASTYKSFGGPPGGLIVGRHPGHEAAIRSAVTGGWTSNYDAARLASLSVAFEEACRFMPEYAKAMLANANSLSFHLKSHDVDVGYGSPSVPAATHQVLVRCADKGQAYELSQLAESIGVYVGTGAVPGSASAGALRIGTQAVTRMGAGPDEMRDIAEIVARVVRRYDVEACHSKVAQVARRLNHVRFCYVN